MTMKKIFFLFVFLFIQVSVVSATTIPLQPKRTQPLIPQANTVIKDEFSTIEKLSAHKAKEALTLQNEVIQAAQKSDKAALQMIVNRMKKFVEDFNQELDTLTLKSPEVNSIRTKTKQINNLSIQLSEEGLRHSPDWEKIEELQVEAIELKEILSTEILNVQNKIDTVNQ